MTAGASSKKEIEIDLEDLSSLKTSKDFRPKAVTGSRRRGTSEIG